MTTRRTVGNAIPIVLLMLGAILGTSLFIEQRNQPINALRAKTPIEFEFIVPPGVIVDAIAEAYGVYVNLEYPNEPGGKPAVLPEMQPSAAAGDSLETFFESIEEESKGLLTGLQIGDTVNIVPAKRGWTEHRSNLDRIIGADIENATAAAALRAIADAVNQYSVEGYPLKLNPGGIRAGFVPPEAFRTTKVGPIVERGITAREAICRVLADLPYPAAWVYGHTDDAAYLTIRFYENGELMRREPASEAEKAYWTSYAEMSP